MCFSMEDVIVCYFAIVSAIHELSECYLFQEH